MSKSTIVKEIKNINGRTYHLLQESDDVALLVDEYGTYIVALETMRDEEGRIRWSHGVYFDDGYPNVEGNPLSVACDYYNKRIKK